MDKLKKSLGDRPDCTGGVMRAQQWVVGSFLCDMRLCRFLRGIDDHNLFPDPELAAVWDCIKKYIKTIPIGVEFRENEFYAMLHQRLAREAILARAEASRGGNFAQKISDSMRVLAELNSQNAATVDVIKIIEGQVGV